ncbi:Polyketide cyclase/dehydrase OS=Tsukamurella paurometabola (strain ATCC 8368 / DSM / CCUG 35730/ CIP 100753 / JCM 10117 / KCTC 9821 / NBRC 16120 / NCIMB 702349 / NCTC 13040) OX=521096 GN=Tpau_3703 PE=4 SV=1 [Tsukamurella paurometabola]|uniref:Polyketide cyclase/dehydrase n=1 Tax=Tsukamurella paurometabola (strain ATCC 8368 / DSM 20162 / CCUG 35730 / CIP 100753 / JCM 10117 / KCTC 9821 / NBRC 16120 / NCIMB 702349 / NCTC 13040) TaxID=521096 RepID=D5UY44_TSUPD|nr:SRPBCC family protein [Tsukamurella paurometabola]ADG80281.1 Polyketide cyclase/dehydrase [Tsukamurella paurometabola DSM 20162]SUP39127.1 Polyketide cyclase / dehydrase and lipid transport [Tsukamurella paurometabola]
MATPVLESSVVIDAPIEKVWSVVSDLEGMGKRSPQCKKVFVFGGPIKEGTRMLNINKQGWRVWPTNTKVIEFKENERIAFRVAENHTVWSFTLVPEDGKVTVVERREAAGGRTTAVSSILVGALLGGNEDFERGLLVGMKQTLSHIKTESEAA